MSDKEKNPIEELNALPGTLRPLGTFEAPDAGIDPMSTPIWEQDRDALNPFEPLPPIQTWCRMGNRPAFPKEGIILIQAKPKQGKSFSVYAALIPLLTLTTFNSITPLDRPRLVLVFDMEMSRTTLTNRVYRQVRTLGEDGKRFVVFPIKHLNRAERMPFIQAKVARYSPDVVVIDQAGKLVDNANDEVEATKVVNELEQLGIGRTVFTIQHENFGTDNTKARGSVGSQLLFAQVECYSATKGNGVFTLTPKEARDTDTEGAEPFVFVIDEEGQIKDGAKAQQENEDENRAAWINDLSRVFGEDETLTHGEIVRRVQEQLNGASKTTAEGKVRRAKEIGAIVKVETGKQRSPYRLANYLNSGMSDFDDLDNL